MDSTHRRPRRPQRGTPTPRHDSSFSERPVTDHNPTKERAVNMATAGVLLAFAVGVSAVVLAVFLRIAFWVWPS